jgi:hypothetical protein
MRLVFVEMPAFARRRADYLDDLAFARLQTALLANPEAGLLVPDTGGLRKLRWPDAVRGKGKRGGLRIVYYYFRAGSQLWLFAIYGKGEVVDLTPNERRLMKISIDNELRERRRSS